MSGPYVLSLQTAGVQNSLTITFSNSVVVGNVVIVTFGFQQPASPATTGVTDNKGNTYTKLKEFQGGSSADCISVWGAPVTTGGTSFQVTATAALVGRPGIVIEEFADISTALTVLASDGNSGFGPRSVTTASAPAVILNSAYASNGVGLFSDPPFVSDHLESGFCSVLTTAVEKLATGTFSNSIYGGTSGGATAMVALASYTSTGSQRSSQQVLETPLNVGPSLRASQAVLEVPTTQAVGAISYRATQAVLESPINPLIANVNFRASQVVLEPVGGLPVMRASQIVVEIPIIPGTPPPPPGVQPLVFVAGER